MLKKKVPQIFTIVTLKQPQDKLMFQNPNTSLANANNTHCSLHIISQVDMMDSQLADIKVNSRFIIHV